MTYDQPASIMSVHPYDCQCLLNVYNKYVKKEEDDLIDDIDRLFVSPICGEQLLGTRDSQSDTIVGLNIGIKEEQQGPLYRLSRELTSFLKLPTGTALPRNTIPKLLHEYFVNNNLIDPENNKIILPDAKLIALFKLNPSDKLGYFNLMHYVKPHVSKVFPEGYGLK